MTIESFESLVSRIQKEHQNHHDLEADSGPIIRLVNSFFFATVVLNQNQVEMSYLKENSTLVSISNHPSFEVLVPLSTIQERINHLPPVFKTKFSDQNVTCSVQNTQNKTTVFISKEEQ